MTTTWFERTTLSEDATDRIKHALAVGRDCVVESFEYVESADDQLMADARIRAIDEALGILSNGGEDVRK